MKTTWVCFVLLTAAATLSPLPAAATELASEAFSFKYEGDIYPVPNYTANDNGSWVTSPSTDGNILTYQPSVASGSQYFVSNQWAANISNSTGFTFEMRLKIGTETEGAAGTIRFELADGGSGEGQVFQIGQSKFQNFLGGSYSTANNTDDFHVFRVAQDSNSNTYKLWRDGQSLGSFADGLFTENFMYWGDGAGGVGGASVQLDYIRWTTGAYDPLPVPEPAAGLLTVFAAIGGVICRRFAMR